MSWQFYSKNILEAKIENANRLDKKLYWKVKAENNNENKEKDKKVVRVIEEIKKTVIKVLRENEWKIVL